jgi:WD40 repeat protein
VTGTEGFLGLVDWRRGRVVKRLRGHTAAIWAPSFSADGRRMATGSLDDTARLWALPSGRPVGAPLRYVSLGMGVGDLSLSPDGRSLAVTHDPGVEIVDVATRRPRLTLSGTESVHDFARFTADGRRLLVGSRDGWARVWSAETGKPVSRAFAGQAGSVMWGSLSPDGRTLATGSTDGTVRLWDLPTQRPVGAALPGVPNSTVHPQFTPDGNHLFAVTNAGRAFRWDVRPSRWARYACAVAGRALSRAEWREDLPEREYAPACAG